MYTQRPQKLSRHVTHHFGFEQLPLHVLYAPPLLPPQSQAYCHAPKPSYMHPAATSRYSTQTAACYSDSGSDATGRWRRFDRCSSVGARSPARLPGTRSSRRFFCGRRRRTRRPRRGRCRIGTRWGAVGRDIGGLAAEDIDVLRRRDGWLCSRGAVGGIRQDGRKLKPSLLASSGHHHDRLRPRDGDCESIRYYG